MIPTRHRDQRLDIDSVFALENAASLLREKLVQTFESLFSGTHSLDQLYLQRLEIAIPEIDPLEWLQNQPFSEKLYLEDRDGSYRVAGIGLADQILAKKACDLSPLFSIIRERLKQVEGHARYFGGMRFNGLRLSDASWQQFGFFRFTLPRFEILQEEGNTFFACNLLIRPGEDIRSVYRKTLSELEQVVFAKTGEGHDLPRLLHREDFPSQEEWHNQILHLLHAFDRHEVEKVVLARKSVFTFSDRLEAICLLRRLRAANPHLFYFYFQPSREEAFLGGSPERLYRRIGHQIKSEAIAGTRPRGQTIDEDQRLGRELLESEKDQREHRFVLDTIRQTLEQFCHTVDIDNEVSLLKLARVQHLCCRLQGVLHDRVNDVDLLKALHPTPAVGGSPTSRALQAIRELEPFDRGWYAGPVGWLGADAAGLVQGNTLSLFSGAGIVQGSTPEAEWQEIENKISNFMKIFHLPC